MNIIITTLQGVTIPVTPFLANVEVETSLEDIYTTLSFDLPYGVAFSSRIGAFSRVTAYSVRGFKFSGIIINAFNDNLERVSITAVSDSFYLTQHEVLIKVNKYPAQKVIQQVLSDYDGSLTVAGIPLTAEISKIYNGETILGVIDDVIEIEEGAKGRKIFRVFDGNILKIFTDPLPYVGGLVLYPSMSGVQVEDNGEDVKTKIKVYAENNKDITVLTEEEDATAIAKMGLIQKVYKITGKDEGEAKSIAKNLLKIYTQLKTTGSVTMFGDYTAKVGLSIPLQGDNYIISSVRHTIKDQIHLMDLGLIKYEK